MRKKMKKKWVIIWAKTWLRNQTMGKLGFFFTAERKRGSMSACNLPTDAPEDLPDPALGVRNLQPIFSCIEKSSSSIFFVHSRMRHFYPDFLKFTNFYPARFFFSILDSLVFRPRPCLSDPNSFAEFFTKLGPVRDKEWKGLGLLSASSVVKSIDSFASRYKRRFLECPWDSRLACLL